jgi:hypothetical protein
MSKVVPIRTLKYGIVSEDIGRLPNIPLIVTFMELGKVSTWQSSPPTKYDDNPFKYSTEINPGNSPEFDSILSTIRKDCCGIWGFAMDMNALKLFAAGTPHEVTPLIESNTTKGWAIADEVIIEHRNSARATFFTAYLLR